MRERWLFMRPARALSPCAVVSAIQVSHVAITVCFCSLHGRQHTCGRRMWYYSRGPSEDAEQNYEASITSLCKASEVQART